VDCYDDKRYINEVKSAKGGKSVQEKILLVEDDRDIVAYLSSFLKNENFIVEAVAGQREAIEKLETREYDLLLIDISLADGNGYAVCAAAKEKSPAAVIFLTASGDEYSVVTGLDMGADDYINKPFRPRELVSRIRSVLRRTGKSQKLLKEGSITVDTVNHRVPVIAGAGSNDTDHGCALAAKSAACGADALLMVTPYYNKTSQAGLVAHFTAMAEAGGIPVILYNVPSRTGLNIAPETALELSKHPLINGIKEASGNISQVAKVAALCGDALNIYSGNDDQVVPLLALGGKGVISVVSNVAPELVHNCCQAFFDRDTAKACALQLEMLPLEEALFCEVNPIPVKYAMNVLGWNAGECRLPLVEPSDAHKAKIEQALQAAGLIKE